MTARLLDGRAVADDIFQVVAREVGERAREGLHPPHLAAVLVGEDPASETYVRLKRRDAERLGMTSSDPHLPESATTEEVTAVVRGLNEDDLVSGILVQTPLPPQVDTAAVQEAVDPIKDVDCLHPFNAGRLFLGHPGVLPCTPAGIVELLDRCEVPIEGRHAVVIGRSNIVGKPVAILLLARHATVTVCHSRTRDLAAICRTADILVAAAGKAHMIAPVMVKPGAAVVDVGVSRVEGKLTGDVDPAVAEVAGWLTPNPGGVGPMTRAMLMRNTLWAERRRRGR